jgi:hypothetical protein
MSFFKGFSSNFNIGISDPDQYRDLLRRGRGFIEGRGRRSRTQRRNPFSGLKDQKYDDIKAKCQEDGILFEDPEFEATDESLFFSQSMRQGIKWLRPSVSRQ